jgi:hypothetical protein
VIQPVKPAYNGLRWNLNVLKEQVIRRAAEWLALLLRVREVPVSSLGPETGYPD